MNQCSDPLVGAIPTKWSRWCMGLTTALTIFAYTVPSHLPQKWLPNSEEQVFLIRLLLSETTLLLGSLVTLFLIVLAYNKQSADLEKLKKAIHDYVPLPKP